MRAPGPGRLEVKDLRGNGVSTGSRVRDTTRNGQNASGTRGQRRREGNLRILRGHMQRPSFRANASVEVSQYDGLGSHGSGAEAKHAHSACSQFHDAAVTHEMWLLAKPAEQWGSLRRRTSRAQAPIFPECDATCQSCRHLRHVVDKCRISAVAVVVVRRTLLPHEPLVVTPSFQLALR